MKKICRWRGGTWFLLWVLFSLGPRATQAADGILDYERFMSEIEPLLTTTTYASPGPGLMSCYDCHGISSHPAFTVYPLFRGQPRRNFTETVREITIDNPDTSVLLLKPLHEAAGGIQHGTDTIKSGGRQFPNVDDDTYQIILNWIYDATRANKGARITKTQPHPNPFRYYTDIVYFLSTPANKVTVTLYTSSGHEIQSFPGTGVVGANKIRWNGRDEVGDPMPTGVYFYSVKAQFDDGEIVSTGRCVYTP